jgi:hypothetical protein
MDESSNVSNTAHLTFVRSEAEEPVKEELLYCLPLLGCTTSNNIFKKSERFMKVRGLE